MCKTRYLDDMNIKNKEKNRIKKFMLFARKIAIHHFGAKYQKSFEFLTLGNLENLYLS